MNCPNAVIIGGKKIELVNCMPKKEEEWNLELAKLLAEINGLKITGDAVKVLQYVRQFWGQHGVCPPVSVIEADVGIDRKTLLQLFGGRYDNICILAGLEPPSGCLSQILSTT